MIGLWTAILLTISASGTVAFAETAQVVPNQVHNSLVASEYSPAAINALSSAPRFSNPTPTTGNVNSLVFLIEFKDVKYNAKYQDPNSRDRVLSPDELRYSLFGPGNSNDSNYPYESVRAYYERASYGKLHFNGLVLPYTTKYNRSHYDTLASKGNGSYGFEELMMEVTKYYEDTISTYDFDTDQDGVLDSIYLSVPLAGDQNDQNWWGTLQTWWINPNFKVAGKQISRYIILDGQPFEQNKKYYNQVWLHETGHALGLPDYYSVKIAGEGNPNFEGFQGLAGYDVMDEITGDHNVFSKLHLGWITPSDLQVAQLSKKEKKYKLQASENAPSALLVPIDSWNGNIYSQYYLIEYNKGTENNATAVSDYLAIKGRWGEIGQPGISEGIRIWHVDATIIDDWWFPGRQMFAYDQNMTQSERKLITHISPNLEGGFYRTGDSFSPSSYPSTAYYSLDRYGRETTLPSGITIRIGDKVNDSYEIFVSRQ